MDYTVDQIARSCQWIELKTVHFLKLSSNQTLCLLRGYWSWQAFLLHILFITLFTMSSPTEILYTICFTVLLYFKRDSHSLFIWITLKPFETQMKPFKQWYLNEKLWRMKQNCLQLNERSLKSCHFVAQSVDSRKQKEFLVKSNVINYMFSALF